MVRRSGAERRLATVLFTDIIGSTDLASRLGDRGWKDLVGRHHGIVRAELKRHGGRELDTAGDGFFALFDHPAQAIECVGAIMGRLVAVGLTIRSGVHMGEVEIMGAKVGGMTVHVGARILGHAGPGQIVVTGTVREVAAGYGFLFTELGVRELKGVPGAWQLFAVERSRDVTEAAAQVETSGAGSERSQGSSRRRQILSVVGLGAIVLAVAIVGAALRLSPASPPVVAQPDSAVRLDAGTSLLAASVGVGDRPTGMAIGGGSVWVLNLSDQTVSIIDATTDTVTRTPGLPGRPTGIAAGADSVWITNGFGTAGLAEGGVLRLRYATRGVDEQIPVGDGVRGVAVGEGGVWVTNPLRGTVTRIDEVTRGLGEPVPVGQQPDPIAVAFGQVWIGDVLGRSLWRLDPATRTAEVAVTLRDPPTAIASGFDRLWVASTQGNSLSVVDPVTRRLVRSLDIGRGPRGLAVSADAVWVALGGGQLVRVDPLTLGSEIALTVPGPAEGVAAAGQAVWASVQR